jgi:hypothetical protein
MRDLKTVGRRSRGSGGGLAIALTTTLFAGGCPLAALADQDRIALSCHWSVEQMKWGLSGQIVDQETFDEDDNFVLDKARMTGTRGSSTVEHRTYKMTINGQSISLSYIVGSDSIKYLFDMLSFTISENRTTLFPQGKMTLAGTGRCSTLLPP